MFYTIPNYFFVALGTVGFPYFFFSLDIATMSRYGEAITLQQGDELQNEREIEFDTNNDNYVLQTFVDTYQAPLQDGGMGENLKIVESDTTNSVDREYIVRNAGGLDIESVYQWKKRFPGTRVRVRFQNGGEIVILRPRSKLPFWRSVSVRGVLTFFVAFAVLLFGLYTLYRASPESFAMFIAKAPPRGAETAAPPPPPPSSTAAASTGSSSVAAEL